MKIGVTGPIFTHKNIIYSMGKLYSCSTRWEKNMDAILNIYETMAIFLLFNDHQDTEYDSCEL